MRSPMSSQTGRQGSSPTSPSKCSTWSMPDKLPPLPEEFGCCTGTVINLREKTHEQLLAIAAKHNKKVMVPDDPFQAVLQGIPERAKLRPDSRVATTYTLGDVPEDSPYFKAWRTIKRPAKLSAKALAAAQAAKRAEAATAAARLAKLHGKGAAALAAAAPGRQPVRQQQHALPPEQVRWRSKLAAFLGRVVEVPVLSSEAPILDLNKLFLDVMEKGGSKDVTKAGGWAQLALYKLQDADLADELQQVYDCYLHPLEKDLPYGFRPARNVDHLESRTQQRAVMGSQVATYDAVVFAAHQAAAALKQLGAWATAATPHEHYQTVQKQQSLQQQQQQRQQGKGRCTQVVHSTLLLLHKAASDPDGVVHQFQQHNLLPGLHLQLHAACKQNVVAHTSKLSRSNNRSSTKADILKSLEQDTQAIQQVAAAAAFLRLSPSAGQWQKSSLPLGCKQPAAAADSEPVDSVNAAEASVPSKRPRVSSSGGSAGVAVEQSAGASPCASSTIQSGSLDPTEVLGNGRGASPADTVLPAAGAAAAPGQAEPPMMLQVNAAQWLLLSRRAIVSGPPGCDKPMLPGTAAAAEGAARPHSVPGNKPPSRPAVVSPPGGKGGKRMFRGITPKCGRCKTCTTSSLHKPCLVNRARLDKGLPPILPGDKMPAG